VAALAAGSHLKRKKRKGRSSRRKSLSFPFFFYSFYCHHWFSLETLCCASLLLHIRTLTVVPVSGESRVTAEDESEAFIDALDLSHPLSVRFSVRGGLW